MEFVCLSFGSNFNDRKKNVEEALREIGKSLSDFTVSGIYETPEVHGLGSSYFNAVATGYSSTMYEQFNSMLKEYELSCGRDSEARKRGEVVIDVDIVIWGDRVIRPKDFSREFFQIGYRQIESVRVDG